MDDTKSILTFFRDRLKAEPQDTRSYEIADAFLTRLTAGEGRNGVGDVTVSLLEEFGIKKARTLAQEIWPTLKAIIPDGYINPANTRLPNHTAMIVNLLRAARLLQNGATLLALSDEHGIASSTLHDFGIRSPRTTTAKPTRPLTDAQKRNILTARENGTSAKELAKVYDVSVGVIESLISEAKAAKKAAPR